LSTNTVGFRNVGSTTTVSLCVISLTSIIISMSSVTESIFIVPVDEYCYSLLFLFDTQYHLASCMLGLITEYVIENPLPSSTSYVFLGLGKFKNAL